MEVFSFVGTAFGIFGFIAWMQLQTVSKELKQMKGKLEVSTRYKNPGDLHKPFSSYTHCVEVTNAEKVLFCAGQVPARLDGTLLASDDFMAQGEQVIENLTSVLSNSGAQLSDVVRLVTYLTNDKDVPHVREILAQHFPVNPPANSVCIVKGLTHPDILIEIEATAVI